MQKQEVETSETGRKVRFLESALDKEEEKVHFGVEMGQAHYTTVKRGQRRGGGTKVGPRGAGPGACTRGMAAPPARWAPPSRTDSIQEEDGGAGVHSLCLDAQEPATTPI
jgi:hypothetical protein